MARQKRTDSASGAVDVMKNAIAGVFSPPTEAKLTKEDIVYWNAIVRARARDEWTENELQVAAQLARTRKQIQDNEDLLVHEGPVLINDRGTQIANPRFSVIEQLTRRQVMLMRSLQVNATASAGRAGDVAPKRAAEKAAREVVNATADLI